MTSIDEAPQPDTGDRVGLPWWSVRRPRVFQLYVGLSWGVTPLALVYGRQLIQITSSVGFAIAALAWAMGHLTLIHYAFRSRLTQSTRARILFLAAVIEATLGAAGVALMTVVPEEIPLRDIRLVTVAPPLLFGAIALVQLSADTAGPRSVDRHP